MDLGADGWQTFRFVTLPVIATALVAGGLLAFALSFDEIVVTTFTAGRAEHAADLDLRQHPPRPAAAAGQRGRAVRDPDQRDPGRARPAAHPRHGRPARRGRRRLPPRRSPDGCDSSQNEHPLPGRAARVRGQRAPRGCTCPDTRAAREPTRACSRRSASRRWPWTSRRSPTASTSAPTRPRSSRPSGWPPRRGGPGAPGSWSTAPRRGTSRRAWRSPTAAGEVVVQRNAHSSTIDALVLSGLRPTFAAPELDPELGIAHCLTAETLAAQRCAATPAAVGAWVISPTYFGAVADVAALAEVAHAPRRAADRRRGVGGAHGLPRGAARARALAGGGPGDLEHPQDRRQPHAVGDAAPRPRRTGD